MAASISDCSAKRRMLVSSIRCTTISSWMTSIPAASNVIHWEASSDWTRFILLEEERGEERERSQNERRAQQVRDAEQPQLGIRGFNEHDCGGKREQLGHEPDQG